MTRVFDGEPWEVPATMAQQGQAVDGKLVVGGGQVGFAPRRTDRLTGGDDLAWDLRALTAVDRAPRTGPFGGGVRRRLRLRFADGAEAIFVVDRPRETGQRLASSAQAHGASLSVGL
jgi:hypothetical protein